MSHDSVFKSSHKVIFFRYNLQTPQRFFLPDTSKRHSDAYLRPNIPFDSQSTGSDLTLKVPVDRFGGRRPAPMARITVAAPVTVSPPAKIPSRDVCPRSSSATIQPRRLVSKPCVVDAISGFGEVPSAIITTSHSISNSEPSISIGERAPRLIGFAEFHPHATDSPHPAFVVAEYLDRIGQHLKSDPFLFGVMHLFDARRKLRFAAAVDDMRIGAETAAVRTASIATLPPPTTTTRWPT